LRNIAVALGNSNGTEREIKALKRRLPEASEMLAEHIRWALQQHEPT
jgi:epoxyqueuosine reductase